MESTIPGKVIDTRGRLEESHRASGGSRCLGRDAARNSLDPKVVEAANCAAPQPLHPELAKIHIRWKADRIRDGSVYQSLSFSYPS